MFRSNDKEYDALVAENRFITDIQLEIERALVRLDISQAELARKANVSEARVSQILSENGKNLQARTIARLAFVLGVFPKFELLDAKGCRLNPWQDDKIDFQSWTNIPAPSAVFSFEAPEIEVANDDEQFAVAA